jgi:putative drug exporter of the RND superfamily
MLRVIGLGFAVGILLDTFVVRTLLVPSAIVLIGRLNGWPSALSRAQLPHDPERDTAVPAPH